MTGELARRMRPFSTRNSHDQTRNNSLAFAISCGKL